MNWKAVAKFKALDLMLFRKFVRKMMSSKVSIKQQIFGPLKASPRSPMAALKAEISLTRLSQNLPTWISEGKAVSLAISAIFSKENQWKSNNVQSDQNFE